MLESAQGLSLYKDASLSELSAQEPDLWQQVMQNIRASVEQNKFEHLAEMAQRAQAVMTRWLNGADSPLASSHHAKQDFIKARMTVLAIEQFIAAFTGSTIKIPLLDRMKLNYWIIPSLEKGRLWSVPKLDKIWTKLRQPATAASTIQNAGFWSIPTEELCLGIKDYAKGREIIEIGAGRGLYVSALNQVGAPTVGVDDCSWPMAQQTIKSAADKITKRSAKEALAELRPTVVLSVWPPPGNSFEREIFSTKSVELYMAIVSRHRFASGNWRDYKSQESDLRGFSCVTNDVINKMMRPIEAEQQLLIFRRKTKHR